MIISFILKVNFFELWILRKKITGNISNFFRFFFNIKKKIDRVSWY